MALRNRYTYTAIRIPPSQSFFDNLYRERRAAKELFYVSKEDEDRYVKDVALLRRVTMREQGRSPPEDITEEEKISSNKSDPESDLDKDVFILNHLGKNQGRKRENCYP